MKASELKEMTKEELQDKLNEVTAELNTLRMNHSISNIENPKLLNHKRKAVARIQTEMRSRELANTK